MISRPLNSSPKAPPLTRVVIALFAALMLIVTSAANWMLNLSSHKAGAVKAQAAVSRLVLDNFAHIKAYWQMMTAKIAQIALRFGADDIDGTVIEEKIYHDAGATTPQGMRREQLVRLITEAGRTPIERDTLYRPVTRTENTFTVAV